MWLVKEMKTEGILKEFTLGQGESIILKAGISSDIMLLATGEVDVIELDQISRHLSSSDEKRRPVKLLNNTSITFYARTPSTLFRIDQEYLDFYDSWFAMIEYISHERQTLRIY
jgi:CRP-like cAMP-binding protein